MHGVSVPTGKESGMDMIALRESSQIAIPSRVPAHTPGDILSFRVQPANTTPTAIPHRILLKHVTRTKSIVVLDKLFGPSTSLVEACICGITWSISSRNRFQSKSITAGIKASLPMSELSSMAGLGLHVDAL